MASSDHRSAPAAGETWEVPIFSVMARAASLRPSRQTLLNREIGRSRFIVVMGVSGTGKSTLGTALAEVLRLPFFDGDDLHPATNVAKMSRGEPLDDVDRRPWLEAIRETAVACVLAQVGIEVGDEERGTEWAAAGHRDEAEQKGEADGKWRPGVIVACSALKKTYRALLRGASGVPLPTHFVYVRGQRDVLMARMERRQGHFMKANMLESQLSTLESPEGEPGVVTVLAEMSTKEQVDKVVEALGCQQCC